MCWGDLITPVFRMAAFSGSTTTHFMAGFFSFKNCEVPIKVPPLPMYDFRPEGFQHFTPFHAVAFRHNSDEWITQLFADDRHARSHVPAGHFHHGLPLFQVAPFIRVLDYLIRGPVFHASAGLHVFRFSMDYFAFNNSV